MNKHNCRNALSSMMSSVTVACYGCDLGSLIGRNALSSMMSSVTYDHNGDYLRFDTSQCPPTPLRFGDFVSSMMSSVTYQLVART